MEPGAAGWRLRIRILEDADGHRAGHRLDRLDDAADRLGGEALGHVPELLGQVGEEVGALAAALVDRDVEVLVGQLDHLDDVLVGRLLAHGDGDHDALDDGHDAGLLVALEVGAGERRERAKVAALVDAAHLAALALERRERRADALHAHARRRLLLGDDRRRLRLVEAAERAVDHRRAAVGRRERGEHGPVVAVVAARRVVVARGVHLAGRAGRARVVVGRDGHELLAVDRLLGLGGGLRVGRARAVLRLLLLGRGRGLGRAAARAHLVLLDRDLDGHDRARLLAALGAKGHLGGLALADGLLGLLLGLGAALRDGALTHVGGHGELAEGVAGLVVLRQAVAGHGVEVGVVQLQRHALAVAEEHGVARILFLRLVVAPKDGQVDLLALVARHEDDLRLDEARVRPLALQEGRVRREAAVRAVLAHVAQQVLGVGDAALARVGVLDDDLDVFELHVHARRVEVLGADGEGGAPGAVLEVLEEDVGDVVAPARALGARGVVPVAVLDVPALEAELLELVGHGRGQRDKGSGGGETHLRAPVGGQKKWRY
ncbi:MAG: hypothetical protein CL844_03605 [Crocinitomicaceae bacterium]|nr:hypothetical protein [Crocinitomicaceae bacterium]